MKKSFALVLALAMSLTGASALAAEKVTVRFGNTAGEDDIQSISLRDVAGRLAEATDGNFDAQVYLSSSLGDTDDLTEQAMQGAPIVTVSDPSRLQSFVKDYGCLLYTSLCQLSQPSILSVRYGKKPVCHAKVRPNISSSARCWRLRLFSIYCSSLMASVIA